MNSAPETYGLLAESYDLARRAGDLEAALRGLWYWIDRVHRECGASMDPRLLEAMELAERTLNPEEAGDE